MDGPHNQMMQLLNLSLETAFGRVRMRRTSVQNAERFVLIIFYGALWYLCLYTNMSDTVTGTFIAASLAFATYLSVRYDVLSDLFGMPPESMVGFLVITNLYVWIYALGAMFWNTEVVSLSMGESHLILHDSSIFIQDIQVRLTGFKHVGQSESALNSTAVLYEFASNPELSPEPLVYSVSNKSGFVDWADASVRWGFSLNQRSSVIVSYSISSPDDIQLLVTYQPEQSNYGSILKDGYEEEEISRSNIFGNGSQSFSAEVTGWYNIIFVREFFFDAADVSASFEVSSMQYNTTSSKTACQLAPNRTCHVRPWLPFVITTPVLESASISQWTLTMTYQARHLLYIILTAGTLLWSRFIISLVESPHPIRLYNLPRIALLGALPPERTPMLQPPPTSTSPHRRATPASDTDEESFPSFSSRLFSSRRSRQPFRLPPSAIPPPPRGPTPSLGGAPSSGVTSPRSSPSSSPRGTPRGSRPVVGSPAAASPRGPLSVQRGSEEAQRGLGEARGGLGEGRRGLGEGRGGLEDGRGGAGDSGGGSGEVAADGRRLTPAGRAAMERAERAAAAAAAAVAMAAEGGVERETPPPSSLESVAEGDSSSNLEPGRMSR